MLAVQGVTESPLFVGAGPQAGNVVRGLSHVPGSVLRGALAAEWIRRHGPPRHGDVAFTATFDGQVRFGPLLPAGAVQEPASVRRCKHRPRSGCHDETVDLLAGDQPRQSCKVCNGPLEAGKGRLLDVVRETHTRVELTPDETARAGNLFSRQAIPAGTTLAGHIAEPTPWIEDLDGVTLWFGGRRSVAGRLTIQLTPAPDPTPPNRGHELALALRSPGVFVDAATRPVLGFPAEAIARELGLTNRDGVVVREQWVRAERISGWHAASGLPKPEDVAVAAGSAARVELAEAASSEGLARLARRGLGLRRSEGLGLVEVNPPRWRPPPRPRERPWRVGRRAEVEAVLVAVRDLDDQGRLVDWLCQALRQQAERAEAGRPWPVDQVLDQRADLRYAGRHLRDTLRGVLQVPAAADGQPGGRSASAELQARADQIEGAR